MQPYQLDCCEVTPESSTDEGLQMGTLGSPLVTACGVKCYTELDSEKLMFPVSQLKVVTRTHVMEESATGSPPYS